MKHREKQLTFLKKAQAELYNAGQYRQSASAAHEIAKLAAAFNNQREIVYALYWEGESLERAGDPESALTPLLRAANMRLPDVDPADNVGAMLVAIDVAQQRKPLEYVLRLLRETGHFLEGLGKDQWGDSIMYREARIALARGQFATALAKHVEAWTRRTGAYPSYTVGSHLRGLCEASFFLHDLPALSRWATTFWEQRTLDVEEAGFTNSRPRFLLFGQGIDAGSGLALSRSLLDRALGMDLRPAGGARSGLRMLLLCGAFEEGEHWWGWYRERKTSLDYFDQLLACDWQLALARARLGLPAQDDEWDTQFSVPHGPIFNRDQALVDLGRAECYLRDLHRYAASEDERLETGYYTQTVEGRLKRVEVLRAALGKQ